MLRCRGAAAAIVAFGIRFGPAGANASCLRGRHARSRPQAADASPRPPDRPL